MTCIPDETPTTCACGARTYTPNEDHWQKLHDGWWCHGCLKEGTP